MAKGKNKQTEESKAAITQQNGVPRTRALAGEGISTEAKIDRALDAIFDDLADDRADVEKTRYMLSAIGKRLNMENMKIRAGFYKGGGHNVAAGANFFLKA